MTPMARIETLSLESYSVELGGTHYLHACDRDHNVHSLDDMAALL